jgi:hypothetical protein
VDANEGQTPPKGSSWQLCPVAFARVPALPYASLEPTILRASFRLHAEVGLRRREVECARDHVVQRLGELVHRAPPLRRRLLLDLRRSVFDGRLEKAGDTLSALQLVGAPLEACESWQRSVEVSRAVEAERDECFARERQAGAHHTLELLNGRWLRLALELGSPRLAAVLDRLHRTGIASDRRARQALRTGMAHVWRAAYKPIPCSYFASTARIRFVDGEVPGPLALGERSARLRPDRRMLAALAGTLLRHPQIRPHTLARLAADHLGELTEEASAEVVRRLEGAASQREHWSRLASDVDERLLERALESGLLELDSGASESDVDDLDILIRLTSVAGAPEELSAQRAALESYRRVVEVLSVPRRPRFESLEEAEGVRSLVHEDTFFRAPIARCIARIRPFFEEIVRYGAELCCPEPTPEALTLSALFDDLSPGGRPVPLHAFYRSYRERARLPPPEDTAALRSVRAAVALALERGAVLRPEIARLDAWRARTPRRISLRFTSAGGGDRDRSRFFVSFWGSDRMSLLPRYATLPFADGDATPDVRAWMRGWPSAADIVTAPSGNPDLRPRVTRRCIAGPSSRVEEGDIPLGGLWLAKDRETGGVELRAGAEGERLDPVFLGVSAAHRLAPIVQLLLQMGQGRPSYLDLVYRVLHGVIVERATGSTSPASLPELRLGDHILVSPRLAIVPREAWPKVPDPYAPGQFFQFHDWLSAHEIPAGVVQARGLTATRDAQWLDLRHPDGVWHLLRTGRDTAHTVVMDSPMPDADEELCTEAGCFCIETYAELGWHIAAPLVRR